MNILFDMETRDPDDMFALCFLASHPQITLRAVTVNPGSRAQLGVVSAILKRLGLPNVPIGARNPDTERDAVSPFHYDFLGSVPPIEPAAVAHDLMAEILSETPETVLFTGAPLHNARLLLKNHPSVVIHRWVAQGGFAGDNVVPEANRLPKFTGLTTCLTFNFCGDPKATLLMLGSAQVRQRDLVSKNVCHGIVYDLAMHERMGPFRNATPGLQMIHLGMELYLRQDPRGKMFHDPLAACIAVNREIATFREVEVYQEHGQWGSILAENTDTFITIDVDRERSFETLVAY